MVLHEGKDYTTKASKCHLISWKDVVMFKAIAIITDSWCRGVVQAFMDHEQGQVTHRSSFYDNITRILLKSS